jgi:hypothetical protein
MTIPIDAVQSSQGFTPDRGSIWLVGDHYHGWMAFERKPGVDNDPEHQPSHVELHRRPRFHYAPGGAWYVKKFLDRAWNGDLLIGRAITLACPSNDEEMGEIFIKPEAFAPYHSTVSFTLDAFPRSPDGPAEDTAFRIKCHYGYHSTEKAIKRDRAALQGLQKLEPAASEACRSKLDDIARIEERYHKSAVTYLDAFRKLTKGSHPKLLIIDDMDMGFRNYRGFAGNSQPPSNWGSFLKEHFTNEPSVNHILVLLGRSLPGIDDKTSKISRAPRPTGLWAQLTAFHADQTIIIVNADLLRDTGAPINKRTAWERTAEDTIGALNDRKLTKLRSFEAFAHVIIRCGVTGAIHCYREASGKERVADLYYDSKADGGFFRDVDKEGGIVGNNSVFTACVAKHLLDPNKVRTPIEGIGAGIAAAIPICQRFFRGGYRIDSDKAAAGLLEEWSDPPVNLFMESAYKASEHKGNAPTHSTLIDKVRIADEHASGRWYIAAPTKKDNSLQLAHEIVVRGLPHALNNPSLPEEQRIFAPVGSFGDLKTIDRDEIEGFYAISNVIRQYLEVISRNPLAGPMSIAVFGPPGSGKSFTVKEIIRSVDPTVERNFSEINMAQLSSSKELASHLLRVHDIISVGNTPLVFFDEFDCAFDKGPLGWLKYFLAPMEGGTFKHPDEGVFRLGRGIFVFAGGTATTYKEFEEQGTRKTEDGGEVFRDAKGPDFLSRLRGHVNIKGINFAPFPGQNDDKLYPLRRAVILRSILHRTGLVTEVDKTAQIDNSLLDTLLVLRDKEGEKIKKGAVFKYDTRSLKTVVEMCLRLHGRIERASLPPPALLDMHVKSELLYEEMPKHEDLRDTTSDMQSIM